MIVARRPLPDAEFGDFNAWTGSRVVAGSSINFDEHVRSITRDSAAERNPRLPFRCAGNHHCHHCRV